MKIIKNPPENTWVSLCKRPVLDKSELDDVVKEIIRNVRESGDNALREYSLRFDKINTWEFKVSEREIAESSDLIPETLKSAIDIAKNNIEYFHSPQLVDEEPVETAPGVICWRESVPIEKVGLYIPGGTAPLFSTILMLGVPARIAGCKQIVLCTPPDSNGKINPAILYTAGLLGILDIYKVGGAQAIGAMAYGTESIPKVYKIFGPGNQYVNKAKELVQIEGIAIDLPAGPSEVLVIADQNAKPDFVAADLLSQAEHGSDSQVVLLTDNENLALNVEKEIKKQLAVLPRKELAGKSIGNSFSVVLDSLDDCMEFSNLYAPEHLIINTKNFDLLANKVENAGSVFLGPYSCESAGDYASGTNHTLPTNGYAVAYSGVSTDSFLKKITFQQVTGKGILILGPVISIMAEAENLQAHSNAVKVRINSLK